MKLTRIYFLVIILVTAVLYNCKKEYSYEGGSLSSGFILKDSNGNCSLVTIAGNFVAGKNLDDSNYLKVLVHFTQAGRYNIQSELINGYSFSSSGNVSDTGIVLLQLKATGKPISQGMNAFNIVYNTSVCRVIIAVTDTIMPVLTTNPDHFPITESSHWTYDDLIYPGDSVIRTITGSGIQAGTPHQLMDEYKSFFPANNRYYFKKVNDDYFQYTSVSGFTSSFNFSPSIYDDLNFLKENISTNYNWYSGTYSGRTSLTGQSVNLRYHFHCLDADATVNINGKTFVHVYKIQMMPEEADIGLPVQPTGEIHTFYYAKGVGLVYEEFYNAVLSHPVMQIRSWTVN